MNTVIFNWNDAKIVNDVSAEMLRLLVMQGGGLLESRYDTKVC